MNMNTICCKLNGLVSCPYVDEETFQVSFTHRELQSQCYSEKAKNLHNERSSKVGEDECKSQLFSHKGEDLAGFDPLIIGWLVENAKSPRKVESRVEGELIQRREPESKLLVARPQLSSVQV